jgi:ADP-ribose pyrophosphatase YjhB (NUDIX family)
MSEIDRHLSEVTFTSAVVGYLRGGDKVLLGERKKVSSGLGQNLIAGIGGKVGDSPEIQDETPDQAMDREANEEIGGENGLKVIEKTNKGRVRFIFAHKAPDSKWNQDVLIYEITKWEGEPTETESTKPMWFDKNEIPWEKMWEDNEKWLPLVLSGEQVDAIFLFSGDNKIAEFRFNKPSNKS